MSNDTNNVANLTVEILKEIRDSTREGFAELREGFTELREGFAELSEEVNQLKVETVVVKGELVRLNGRFDHLLDFAGDRYRGHEERLRALEAVVFHKT